MSTLPEALSSGSLPGVILLFGPEHYLRRRYKAQVREAVTGGDEMNCTVFSGKNPELREVKDLAETMPFFAERRLIILEDTGLFSGSHEDWAAFAAAVPDSCVLLFDEETVDKRGKLYKAVLKAGIPCDCQPLEEKPLQAWAVRYLGKAGKRITGSGCARLLEYAGPDLDNLASEMEKLIAAVGEGTDITEDTVKDVCIRSLESSVFALTDAVAAGEEARAMAVYTDMLARRESGMRLLALIERQFRQLLAAKECGGGRNAIMDALHVSYGAAGRLSRQAERFSGEKLQKLLAYCAEQEAAFKSGRLSEQLALEMVIVTALRQ